jgi:hypothetical protein
VKNLLKPPLIPPIACDLIQTALCACDGAEFVAAPKCPACGGFVQGYDSKKKKFAVIRDGDKIRTLSVTVKRFTCRTCGTLCYAGEPFYPETRLGSPVIDLCTTLAATRAFSRTATVLDAMGIVVDRSSCRKYGILPLPSIPSVDVFGIQLPFSIVNLSALTSRFGEGTRIPDNEILAACGYPSLQRVSPVPEQNCDEDNKEP